MTNQTAFFPFRRHALALALALVIDAGYAETIQVKAGCTLANAIINANNDSDTDGAGGCIAGSGSDIINLKANTVYTFNQADNNTDGDNALPSVSSVITINGNNATLNRSNAKGTPDFRLLHIANNGKLTINKLNLTGGKAPLYNYNRGGAIYNRGSLALNKSRISKNQADTDGGGIANLYGTIALTDSHLAGNKAVNGGGVWNHGGKITLTNSTISGNTASNGAGINNAGGGNSFGCYGSVSLLNSTISGNKGVGIQNQDVRSTKYYNYYGGGGGGYYRQERCQMTIVNSTIANNSGSGIDNRGVLILGNSLIAGNTSDCVNSAELNTSGVNLIENNTCNAQLNGNPRLSPLLDNGGPTPTHALLTGSQAINQAAKIFCPKTDQRNIKRLLAVNGACDIGAYQRQTFLPKSITVLLQFFDSQASVNALVGIKPQKREAVRRQILTAGEYEDRNLTPAACNQLKRTLDIIDRDDLPDQNDYITGISASDLAQMIAAQRTIWQCK